MEAGPAANSLKCVGERGKEASVSSQRPRHLVEEPGEDRDQITNTQPLASTARPGQREGQEGPGRTVRGPAGLGVVVHEWGVRIALPWRRT